MGEKQQSAHQAQARVPGDRLKHEHQDDRDKDVKDGVREVVPPRGQPPQRVVDEIGERDQRPVSQLIRELKVLMGDNGRQIRPTAYEVVLPDRVGVVPYELVQERVPVDQEAQHNDDEDSRPRFHVFYKVKRFRAGLRPRPATGAEPPGRETANAPPIRGRMKTRFGPCSRTRFLPGRTLAPPPSRFPAP